MESEQQTRKKRIDGRLVDARWKVVPFKSDTECAKLKNHAVEERPTSNGPADYALIESGEALGVLEANKVTVGAKVLTQAERGHRGFSKRFRYVAIGKIIQVRNPHSPLRHR